MGARAVKNLGGFLLGLSLALTGGALAQTYNMFHPGGALSGTWNSQNVNVSAGVPFIAGTLPEANTALSVKPSVTVVATTNQTLSGLPTLDGVTTADGSLILNTAQTAGSENGPWVAHIGAWTRPVWYASGSTTQAMQFSTTVARLGTLYQGTMWRQTAASPITIDTTSTTWTETPLAVNATSVANGTTGTAAVVLANSPTLTTPALGTPSALVLTNATGLSDAALSANVPLLNAANSFTGTAQSISNTEPRLKLNQSGAGTDLGLWDFDVVSGVLTGRTRTDADAAGQNWLSVTRGATTAISNIAFGNATNNPTFTFLGTGAVTGSQLVSTLSTGGSTSGFLVNNTAGGGYGWRVAGQGVDGKNWDAIAGTNTWGLRTVNDANSSARNILLATRSSLALTDLSLGNATDNPTFNFLGTGAAQFGGNLTATGTLRSSAAGAGTSSSVYLASGSPAITSNESDQGADLKVWVRSINGGILHESTQTDGFGAGTDWLAVTRGTTTAISNISLGNVTNNPTFTFLGSGLTTFTGTISVGSTTAVSAHRYLASDSSFPDYRFTDTSRGTDLKSWDIFSQTGHLTFETVTDAFSAGSNFLDVTRGATTAISSISVGNATDNPVFTFLGTGQVNFPGSITVNSNGFVTAGAFSVANSSAPPNGMYRSAANTIGFSANTTQIGTWTTAIFDVLTDFAVDTVGKGLQVKEGSNAKQGTCTLVAGTCTVANTSVTANSRIMLTAQTLGTVAVPSGYGISARTAGTSFVILASAPTDTSVVGYEIFEPAP